MDTPRVPQMPKWAHELRGQIKSPGRWSRLMVLLIVVAEHLEGTTGWVLVLLFSIVLGSFGSYLTWEILWFSLFILLVEGGIKVTRKWSMLYQGLNCAEIFAHWKELVHWGRYSLLLTVALWIMLIAASVKFLLAVKMQQLHDGQYYRNGRETVRSCWDKGECPATGVEKGVQAWDVEHRWHPRLHELLLASCIIVGVHSLSRVLVMLVHFLLRLRVGTTSAPGERGLISPGETSRVPCGRLPLMDAVVEEDLGCDSVAGGCTESGLGNPRNAENGQLREMKHKELLRNFQIDRRRRRSTEFSIDTGEKGGEGTAIPAGSAVQIEIPVDEMPTDGEEERNATTTYWFQTKWVSFRHMSAEEFSLYVHFQRHMLLGDMAASQAGECKLAPAWFLQPHDVLKQYRSMSLATDPKRERKVAIMEAAVSIANHVRDSNDAQALLDLANEGLDQMVEHNPMLVEHAAKIFTRVVLKAETVCKPNELDILDKSIKDAMKKLKFCSRSDGSLQCLQTARLAARLYSGSRAWPEENRGWSEEWSVMFDANDYWRMLPRQEDLQTLEPSVERMVVLECLIQLLSSHSRLLVIPFVPVADSCLTLLQCRRADMTSEVTLASRLLQLLLRFMTDSERSALHMESKLLDAFRWADLYRLPDVVRAVVDTTLDLAKEDLDMRVRLLAYDHFRYNLDDYLTEMYPEASACDLLTLAVYVVGDLPSSTPFVRSHVVDKWKKEDSGKGTAFVLKEKTKRMWVLLRLCHEWLPIGENSPRNKLDEAFNLEELSSSITRHRPKLEESMKEPSIILTDLVDYLNKVLTKTVFVEPLRPPAPKSSRLRGRALCIRAYVRLRNANMSSTRTSSGRMVPVLRDEERGSIGSNQAPGSPQVP